MTFLQKLCSIGSKSLLVLAISSCLIISAFAQDIQPSNQGELYRNSDFKGEPISLNVVNADIRDILLYITEQYGINFVIDKSVSAVPVTINVSNVPWNIALDSILRSQELDAQVNGPILRIAQQTTLAKERELQKEIDAAQLDKSPLYTEFVRLNYARASNTLGGEGGGGFTGGKTSANSGSAGGGGGVGGGAGGQSADQGILGIIQKRLSRRGTIEVDGRSNTLIITDVKENISALRKLVYYLDQPTPQVEIESRIVVATRSFSRDLGLKLSVGFSNSDTTGTASTDFGSVAGNTIVSLVTSAIGTTQISALLAAGEQKGQVKTIATPRITTLNNRSAQIESGQQIPITTVQPNSAEGAVVATTEYVAVPLRLQVTPQITNVGTVILNVVAENNSIATGGGSGAPAISVQRMQTEVMVPDGGTTVVGGALFDSESEIKDRTPGLSRIPLFGKLFQRKRIARDTNEIMFFITPRIYRPDYNGKKLSGTDPNNPSSITLLQPVPLGNPPSNSSPNGTKPEVTKEPAVPANNPQGNVPQSGVVKSGNR
jgi:type IV pilus assembly protein PilQ